MTPDSFISHLQARQIALRRDGESLLCDAPAGVMTPDLLAEIEKFKDEILTFLESDANDTDTTASADDALPDRVRSEDVEPHELMDLYLRHAGSDVQATALPYDDATPQTSGYEESIGEAMLDPAVLAALGGDREVLVLSAIVLLLFRYTREPDIRIGVAGKLHARSAHAAARETYGSHRVLRVSVSSPMSAREFLETVRCAVEENMGFSGISTVMLAEAMGLPPDTPLYAIEFNGVDSVQHATDQCAPGIARQPPADLQFAVERRGDGHALIVRYDSRRYRPDTITRMLGHCMTLMSELSAALDTEIGRLKLLTSEEEQALRACNDAAWNEAIADTVHELFERSAAAAPQAPALVTASGRHSYAELNAASNRLAHTLIAQGAGPGTRVAIFCRRSADMVLAMLATLKAGAAYVPIDPAYPRERITLMLEDSGATVVLTQRDIAAQLPEGPFRRLYVESGMAALDGEVAPGNPAPRCTRADLSHVIYTSGSTGMPKGTQIEHRNVLALLDWAIRTYPAQTLGDVLASTSICFDLSVFEIFVPLSVGGTVHLVENVLELPQYPARSSVRLLNTVPSALTQLLRSGGLPSSVDTINLAGEPLPRALVDLAYAQPHVAAVYNLYGPTEDTTYSTWVKVPRDSMGAPTIGIPLPGKAVHILDPDLQPVPFGVVGEIYIGGAGVARGYLNRPELDAERFVVHGDERLYRTGDLARRRADGQIVYLGRSDHQVKVRGFRIELGEIEAVLRRHASVRDVAVIARGSGDATVVAFVVPATAPPDANPLRTHLKATLPGFMLPSSIVFLDAIPLSPNGKVDRNALMKHASTVPRSASTPPRDDLERNVAAVWFDLLGSDAIGVNDNFFEVGGHSLLLLELHERLSAVLGRQIPVMELFRHPTIRSLATFLRGESGTVDPLAQMHERMRRQRKVLAQRRSLPTFSGGLSHE